MNLNRYVLFCAFGLIAWAVPNSVTITDTSNTAHTNHPFTISRVFARGEIAHFAQAVIGGAPVTTQCDVKTRWPDGSVQHALISFLANGSAGASATVSFVDQASGNNTGALTKSAMLAGNWGARIEATNGTLQAADARQIISDWSGQAADTRVTYWLQGPVATQVILEDRTTALQYDLGWDQHKPLHPIFVVTFYPGYTAGVKVEMILENMWTTKLEDQTYSLALKTGKTPAQVYAKPNYLHAAKTRWHKAFWSGTAPGAANIDYNLPYMISTQVLPNWDTSVKVASGIVDSEVNAFNASDRCDLGGHGLWTQYLPQTGGRSDIGTVPIWYAHYLYTFDARLFASMNGLAECAGYNSNHLRESEMGRKYDSAKQVDAYSRPLSLDARPTVYVDLSSNLTSPGDKITPVGATSTAGWTDDIAHEPGWSFVPYLITGDWYQLQELYLRAAALLMFPAPGYADYMRANQWGYFAWAIQTRGQGWGLRDVGHAAFFAPDGSPEKAYFTEKLNSNIEIEEGNHDVRTGRFPPADPACPNYTPSPTASKWCYGRVTIAHNLSNPLQFMNAGGDFTSLCQPVADNHLVPAGDPLACYTSDAPWMAGYKYNVLGHLEELGFALGPLNRAVFLNLLHAAVDPAFNPYLTGAYREPVQRASTLSYYQSWADVLNAFSTAWPDGCGKTYNLRTVTEWTENCGGGGDYNTSAPGYPYIMRGAVSYLAGWNLNDGPLKGADAWNWFQTHLQAGNGTNPVYIVLPRTAVPPPQENKCDLNSDGKVDSLDVQLSILRALQSGGTSTDTQRIVNAALGAACAIP